MQASGRSCLALVVSSVDSQKIKQIIYIAGQPQNLFVSKFLNCVVGVVSAIDAGCAIQDMQVKSAGLP